jgi:tetratricopeptide (TPR) repeat protein
MTRRIRAGALASVLLGSGLLAVCGDRSAADPPANRYTDLTGGWKARPDFDSDGKLRLCGAGRPPNKDGVVFVVVALPDEGLGVMLMQNSWQLELNDKSKSVDVTFDGKAQYHVVAEVYDKHSLLLRMQGDEMVAQFRKAYAMSILLEAQHFDFSLAGTFRLLPVLTNCLRTSSIEGSPAAGPIEYHAVGPLIHPALLGANADQAKKDCVQFADRDRQIAGCSQLLARGANFKNRENRFLYYYRRSLAYSANGQYDSALADLDAASVLDPESYLVFAGRAGVYAKKGEFDRALTNYDAAIVRDPDVAISYVGRGEVYLRNGEPERALGDFNRALRIGPSSLMPMMIAPECMLSRATMIEPWPTSTKRSDSIQATQGLTSIVQQFMHEEVIMKWRSQMPNGRLILIPSRLIPMPFSPTVSPRWGTSTALKARLMKPFVSIARVRVHLSLAEKFTYSRESLNWR